MIWLISTSKCPPNEFYYVQTEGIRRAFDRTPLIGELAAKVADFRNANKLPGASTSQAYQDVVRFTCDRLNNDPAYCMELDANPADLVPNSSAGCGSCGAVVA